MWYGLKFKWGLNYFQEFLNVFSELMFMFLLHYCKQVGNLTVFTFSEILLIHIPVQDIK